MDQWAIDRETHGPAQLHERSVTLSSRLPKTLLCLHGIGNPPAERAVKELPYWLPVAEFERLIAQIKDLRRTRSVEIGLSFDDANESDVTLVLPRLRKAALQATFFIPSAALGRPGHLDGSHVNELHGAGMRIGSHGRTHVDWRGLSASELKQELLDSKVALERLIGRPVVDVAAPYGRWTLEMVPIVRQCGYHSLHTCDGRLWSGNDALCHRLCVRRGDDIPTLIARKLTASGRVVDWVKDARDALAHQLRLGIGVQTWAQRRI